MIEARTFRYRAPRCEHGFYKWLCRVPFCPHRESSRARWAARDRDPDPDRKSLTSHVVRDR
jgi:hypothetical protein